MGQPRRETLTKSAFNPESGKVDFDVVVSYQRLQGILNRRNAADAYTAAYTLADALKKPNAIFEGLRFEDDEDRTCTGNGWRCYVYHPARRYNDKGGTSPTSENLIFLVFINEDRIVYNWTWERADETSFKTGSYLPKNWKDRFGKQIWRSNHDND